MLRNLRHEAFAIEYIVDLNATQAAVRAGYKPSSAGVMGYRIANRPDVKERISQLLEDRRARSEAKAGDIIDRLHKLADMCMQQVPKRDDQGDLVAMVPVNATGATKALELLGRTIGLFTDRTERVDVIELEWQTAHPAGWDNGKAPDPDAISPPQEDAGDPDPLMQLPAPEDDAEPTPKVTPQCRAVV
jgi:phage terminase small subunit